MKHIIVFAGSNSSTSINKQLVTYASQLVDGVSATVLDLNDFEMPIYSSDREQAGGFPKEAIDFVSHLKGADGFIVSLAEHNGAYSTAFKNIFDWASRVEQKTFLNKSLLLMATSPGARGGASVLEMASDRFPRHDANIVAQFSLPSFYDNFSDGKITNEALNSELLNKIKLFKDSL
ncbi:NAD(P)H-dependent FMN reductase [Winogradskyella pacifica]|uniref:NAD(P)H-dependent FMN reductase n=1 Tax=Winogradskyella pacifica TaxID=664642 RepID=A0A3D9LKB3_9FLAO|nr:NAD(P)H-dependent oxidoreductase [Winogradskyella pacifica]REE07831.1 NAD(P)H-dependent FMN reductase [Winogradskyella pacifica]